MGAPAPLPAAFANRIAPARVPALPSGFIGRAAAAASSPTHQSAELQFRAKEADERAELELCSPFTPPTSARAASLNSRRPGVVSRNQSAPLAGAKPVEKAAEEFFNLLWII